MHIMDAIAHEKGISRHLGGNAERWALLDAMVANGEMSAIDREQANAIANILPKVFYTWRGEGKEASTALNRLGNCSLGFVKDQYNQRA